MSLRICCSIYEALTRRILATSSLRTCFTLRTCFRGSLSLSPDEYCRRVALQKKPVELTAEVLRLRQLPHSAPCYAYVFKLNSCLIHSSSYVFFIRFQTKPLPVCHGYKTTILKTYGKQGAACRICLKLREGIFVLEYFLFLYEFAVSPIFRVLGYDHRIVKSSHTRHIISYKKLTIV